MEGISLKKVEGDRRTLLSVVAAAAEEKGRLNQEVKTLERAPSREDFIQFENIINMPRGSQLPRRVPKDEVDKDSYDGDAGGGIGNCLAAIIQTPVLIAGAIIVPVFAIAFIIMGGIFIKQCKIEPMIPIWLLVQGIIMLFGIGAGGMVKRSSKSGSVSLPIKLFSFIIFLLTFAWFISGNVWVYQAWAQDPDYAHFWFENGCNLSLFRLAFIGVIVLDCLFALSFVVGIIAFCLRGCKRR